MSSIPFDIEVWLGKLNLDKFIPMFKENEIETIEDLIGLSSDNLKEMGMIIAPRNKLLRGIEALIPKSAIVQTIPLPSRPLLGSEFMTNSNGFDIYLYPNSSGVPTVAQSLNLKTIMVIGETGSGKSTLLNAMVNYLCGVQITDSFRYCLIDERAVQKQNSQAQSQTNDVTSYLIEDHGKNIRMRVIDTPGFKDTRGLHRDVKIVQDIKLFFETKIESIDYVCLVVRATSTRLTADQRYVFNKILEIFGVDVQKRIVVLFTFCDGGEPGSLAALKADKVPVHRYFKFNNSALLSSNTDEFTSMFWKMGYLSLAEFFEFCKISEPLSLSQTLQVLQERQLLDVKANILGTQLKIGLSELNNMQNILLQLALNKDTMIQSSSFEIDYTETFTVAERSGPNNTQCNISGCYKICHENCAISDGQNKASCGVMNSNGHCTECGHHHKSHTNYRKTIDIVKTKQVKKTLDTMKKMYRSAENEINTQEQLLNGVKTKMARCLEAFIANVGDMSTILKRLNEIALRPNSYDNGQYIDVLIDLEMKEMNPESQKKVRVLEELKERMAMLKLIAEESFDVNEVIASYIKDLNALTFDTINNFRMGSKCVIQ